MKVDLEDLERKAVAASHGALSRVRWFTIDDKTVCWSPTIDGRDTCAPQSFADTFDARDTAHIAASSPPVTLALIARIRELELSLGDTSDALRMLADYYEPGVPLHRGRLGRIRALLEKGVVLP